ncbi:hypothetical protein [Pseudomonas helleri]|uniref:hypothetical protein n=1 Tax=Pseudomonas helleri TaxID=1608996 RepID=UPI003FCF7DB0
MSHWCWSTGGFGWRRARPAAGGGRRNPNWRWARSGLVLADWRRDYWRWAVSHQVLVDRRPWLARSTFGPAAVGGGRRQNRGWAVLHPVLVDWRLWLRSAFGSVACGGRRCRNWRWARSGLVLAIGGLD